MVKGFPNETRPLNEQELRMADWLADILRGRVGATNAATGRQLVEALFATTGEAVNDGARLRAIVHYIRSNRKVKHLIATSRGYYVSSDPDEIARYIESLMERARSILVIAHLMKSDFYRDFGGQKNLEGIGA
jgi:hypothetical protein